MEQAEVKDDESVQIAALKEKLKFAEEQLQQERQSKETLKTHLQEQHHKEVAKLNQQIAELKKNLQDFMVKYEGEKSGRKELQDMYAKLHQKVHGEEIVSQETVDGELIKWIEKFLLSLFSNEEIEFGTCLKLNPLLKTESGRRQFTKVLKATMKQVSTSEISASSFEIMLYLIKTSLTQMDESHR